MAYELVWTSEAEDDFKAIILFLIQTGQHSQPTDLLNELAEG